MYQEERLIEILEHLEKNARISIDDICCLFDVSRDTARRDLVKLEETGSILRTRGGAILPLSSMKVKNYSARLMESSEDKKKIGAYAAQLITSGEKIILDTSTTVQFCAENISAEDCTIITNSITQADILSTKANLEVHLLGGKLHPEHKYVYGYTAIQMLENYFADIAFIGACGISTDGITLPDEGDGQVVRKMIAQAAKTVVLAEYGKFNKKGFFKCANLSEIDVIITNQMPDLSLKHILEENDVEIIIV